MARVVAATKEEGRDWARALLAAAGEARKDEVVTEFERGAFIAFVVPDDIYENAVAGQTEDGKPPTAEQLAEDEGEGKKTADVDTSNSPAVNGTDPNEVSAADAKAAATAAAKAAAAKAAAAVKATKKTEPAQPDGDAPASGGAAKDGGEGGGDSA